MQELLLYRATHCERVVGIEACSPTRQPTALIARTSVLRLFEADLPSAPATVNQNRGTQHPTLLYGKSRAAIYICARHCQNRCKSPVTLSTRLCRRGKTATTS